MHTREIDDKINKMEAVKKCIFDLYKIRLNDDGVYKWDVGCDDSTPQNEFYYRGILEKMNIVSVMLLNRTVEWGKGFFDALENDDWLSAAAALRGAMESAGDARFSMKFFIDFLSKEKGRFEERLYAKTVSNSLCYDYSEIINLLNDFIFANGKRDNERRNETDLPVAQPNTKYIAELGNLDGETGIAKYKDLYANLCELTHPSGIPVRCMYESKDGQIKMNKNYGMYGMVDLYQKACEMSQRIFITPINMSLVLMRLLAVMKINPQNRIHKGIDLTDIFAKNKFLENVQNVFGKDNIKKAES